MIRIIRRRYSSRTIDYTKFTTEISDRRKSSMIRQMTEAYMKTANPDSIFLAGGMPNSTTFPFKEISVTYKDGTKHNISGKDLDVALQYGPTQGYPPLVKKLKELQQRWHSPPRDDWDVLFTTGSQDGASKTFELFLQKGDPVMVQVPTYTGIKGAINPLMPDVIGIEQDADGIIPERIEEVCEARLRDNRPLPKLLYVNPTGANPTGAVLPDERREKIYQLAQKYDFLILEDDAYCFLHFLDKQPMSFFSMDTDGRVIRLDSFSKILSAGLRVGVVTAHKDVLGKLILHVENSTLHTSSLSQMLIHKLLESWGPDRLEQHFKEIRDFYRIRRDVMLEAVERHLTGLAEWTVPRGGMFVWIKVSAIDNILEMVMKKCVPNGVFLLPGNAFNHDSDAPDQHLRLCYSYASAEEINKGLTIVAKLIHEEIAKKKTIKC